MHAIPRQTNMKKEKTDSSTFKKHCVKAQISKATGRHPYPCNSVMRCWRVSLSASKISFVTFSNSFHVRSEIC